VVNGPATCATMDRPLFSGLRFDVHDGSKWPRGCNQTWRSVDTRISSGLAMRDGVGVDSANRGTGPRGCPGPSLYRIVNESKQLTPRTDARHVSTMLQPGDNDEFLTWDPLIPRRLIG